MYSTSSLPVLSWAQDQIFESSFSPPTFFPTRCPFNQPSARLRSCWPAPRSSSSTGAMPSSSHAGDRGPSRRRRPSDHGCAPLHPKRVASGRPARRGCSTRTSPAQSSPSAGCGTARGRRAARPAQMQHGPRQHGCGVARGWRVAHPVRVG